MKKNSKPRKAVVYQATNILNGKRYIGVTTVPLRRRASEHFCHAMKTVNNGHFYRAIRKYGREAFEFQVLMECCDGYEALRMEIEFIKKIRPEYNSTNGGDGQCGRLLSEEARKRISDFHKGKKWHLGRRHSDETKKILSDLGKTEESKNRFARYAKMGPKAMSRPVKCLDDGKIYESASAASREYGVAKSALIELCLGSRYRRTVGGRRFVYMETK